MKGFAIALGMFDSVHIGHEAVIKGVLDPSHRSIVVTFDKIPQKAGGVILSDREKIQKLLATGVDTVEILNFEDVRDMSPKQFLDMLTTDCPICKIACGFNFRFGKNAEGDTEFIKRYCEEKGIEFFVADEVRAEGVTVSTSYIKKLLTEGKVEKVNELLGEPFGFTAAVTKGDGRGKTLGFPTANQIYPESKAPIKSGVYHTKVTVGLRVFDAVTDVGIRPTFERDIVCAESYIIGFGGNCYGKDIQVSFVERIRDEKKFDSVEELAMEIGRNVEYVRNKVSKEI